MNLRALIEGLSRPGAYPHPVDAVVVRQTHISVVFLAGPFAYKIKKPLRLPFLDYGTFERRRLFAEREVTLNRRLAPEVYLGVVPIVQGESGLRVEASGEPVEWAVKMVRLPESANLRALLEAGTLGPGLLTRLARRIAAFHAGAEGGPEIAAWASFDRVRQAVLENFEQTADQVGWTVLASVRDRLRRLTDQALEEHRGRIQTRALHGVPRDVHGDLRLEHVYHFPSEPPPHDLVLVDQIEFNDAFRCADPVSDAAFLGMDLAARGRRDLAAVFREAYFAASGDDGGLPLWPFYLAYRSLVRAKVAGMKHAESEVTPEDRAAALVRARGHWLTALVELEPPPRRPCLVLVGGLPGTGKSTLARALSECAGFDVIRSDEVRKSLAGLPLDLPTPNARREALYSPEWSDRTYARCLQDAGELLFEGRRVLVDARFGEEARRRAFLELADRSGVPSLFLTCEAPEELVRARLAARVGDASDADWAVHQRLAASWEAPGPDTARRTRTVATARPVALVLNSVLDTLRREELYGP